MVVVPQLGGHEQVITANRSGSEQFFERCADLRLVAVALGGVEVAESHLDRGLDGVSRLAVIGERRPKPERRNLSAAIVQGKSALKQILIRCHDVRPPSYLVISCRLTNRGVRGSPSWRRATASAVVQTALARNRKFTSAAR